MATTQDLINAHNGVEFGVTGPDFGQCTAVAHAWEQMTGNPIVYGNAKDTFANAGAEYEQVLNTPEAVVPAGAILVWNANWGAGNGHTAVALPGATATTFKCFEQNDGDGGLPHIGEHNYQDVIGWFIPKNYEGGSMEGVSMEVTPQNRAGWDEAYNLSQQNKADIDQLKKDRDFLAHDPKFGTEPLRTDVDFLAHTRLDGDIVPRLAKLEAALASAPVGSLSQDDRNNLSLLGKVINLIKGTS